MPKNKGLSKEELDRGLDLLLELSRKILSDPDYIRVLKAMVKYPAEWKDGNIIAENSGVDGIENNLPVMLDRLHNAKFLLVKGKIGSRPLWLLNPKFAVLVGAVLDFWDEAGEDIQTKLKAGH